MPTQPPPGDEETRKPSPNQTGDTVYAEDTKSPKANAASSQGQQQSNTSGHAASNKAQTHQTSAEGSNNSNGGSRSTSVESNKPSTPSQGATSGVNGSAGNDHDEPQKLVGRKISKNFVGHGRFVGKISQYNPATKLFMILYNDGDSEELLYDEVKSLLLKPGRPPGTYRQTGKGSAKPSESPPKSPTYAQNSTGGMPKGDSGYREADKLDPAIKMEFEHYIFPILMRMGWRDKLGPNGERYFFPPDSMRQDPKLPDYFTSIPQVLSYIQSNPQLAQLCFPRVDMMGMPSSPGMRKRRMMTPESIPDHMRKKPLMRKDMEGDQPDHPTMRDAHHMGMPHGGMYAGGPGPSGGMGMMMMPGMHPTGPPVGDWGPSPYGTQGPYSRPGEVDEREQMMAAKKVLSRGDMPSREPDDERRHPAMRAKAPTDEVDEYHSQQFQGEGGQWNPYHHQQQMYFSGGSAGGPGGYGMPPMGSGGAPPGSGPPPPSYQQFYGSGQQGGPYSRAEMMRASKPKDRREEMDSPSQRHRMPPGPPQHGYSDVLPPSSMHMASHLNNAREMPGSSYPPSNVYPPASFERRPPRMGMQDISQEMGHHRGGYGGMMASQGQMAVNEMHHPQRMPSYPGQGASNGDQGDNGPFTRGQDEHEALSKLGGKMKPKKDEEQIPKPMDQAGRVGPPHGMDPKRMARGRRPGEEGGPDDGNERDDEAGMPPHPQHSRLAHPMMGGGYEMGAPPSSYDAMGRSRPGPSQSGSWGPGPSGMMMQGGGAPPMAPGGNSGRLGGVPMGMGMPMPMAKHGIPEGHWGGRMEMEGGGMPGSSMPMYGGVPPPNAVRASSMPSSMGMEKQLPPLPGRYGGQGGQYSEVDDEGKSAQPGMFPMGNRRGRGVRNTDAPSSRYRHDHNILVRFFTYYDPPQLVLVDDLLYRYHGRERELFHELFLEYCPGNPAIWSKIEAQIREEEEYYRAGSSIKRGSSPDIYDQRSMYRENLLQSAEYGWNERRIHVPERSQRESAVHHEHNKRWTRPEVTYIHDSDSEEDIQKVAASRRSYKESVEKPAAPVGGKARERMGEQGEVKAAHHAEPYQLREQREEEAPKEMVGERITEVKGKGKEVALDSSNLSSHPCPPSAKGPIASDSEPPRTPVSAVRLPYLVEREISYRKHFPEIPQDVIIALNGMVLSIEMAFSSSSGAAPPEAQEAAATELYEPPLTVQQRNKQQRCRIRSMSRKINTCAENVQSDVDLLVCPVCLGEYHRPCYGSSISQGPQGQAAVCSGCAYQLILSQGDAQSTERESRGEDEAKEKLPDFLIYPREMLEDAIRLNQPALPPNEVSAMAEKQWESMTEYDRSRLDKLSRERNSQIRRDWVRSKLISFLGNEVESGRASGLLKLRDGSELPIHIAVPASDLPVGAKCARGQCQKTARATSRFCSDQCGVLFAEEELVAALKASAGPRGKLGDVLLKQRRKDRERRAAPGMSCTRQMTRKLGNSTILSQQIYTDSILIDLEHSRVLRRLLDVKAGLEEVRRTIGSLQRKANQTSEECERIPDTDSETDLELSDGFVIKALSDPRPHLPLSHSDHENTSEEEKDADSPRSMSAESDVSASAVMELEHVSLSDEEAELTEAGPVSISFNCPLCNERLNQESVSKHVYRCLLKTDCGQSIRYLKAIAGEAGTLLYEKAALIEELRDLNARQDKLILQSSK